VISTCQLNTTVRGLRQTETEAELVKLGSKAWAEDPGYVEYGIPCAALLFLLVAGPLGFLLGGPRALDRSHDGGPPGLGPGRVLLVEEQRGQSPPHVPLHIVRQHIEEDVSPDPVLSAVVDRSHLEVHALAAAKEPLDLGEAWRRCGSRWYGYSQEFPIERLYRDTPLLIVGEGTNEIQQLVIARRLLEQYPL
jgi:hypothetical protein